MIRAILTNGMIRPIDPLPADWADGQELRVESAEQTQRNGPEEFNRWYLELERLCASSDPEDDQRLQTALAEAHEQAKALVRRDMGLK